MATLYKSATKDNITLNIYYDENAESPREWDNLGTITAKNSRYNLSDIEAYKDFNRKDSIYLPVYAYIHSGITISTSPFSCPWDSGQIGYIYVSKDKVRKEFNVKKITKKIREQVIKILNSEIKVYDLYLKGEVYGYEIIEDNEVIESCWGFIGEPTQDNMDIPKEYKELLKDI